MAKKTKKKVKKEPKRINKQQLISLIAEKSGLTQAQTRKALDGILDSINEAMAAGDTVSLMNFGSFKTVKRKNRVGRNPQTGKQMKIKARTVPKFVPGKALRESVKALK